MSGEAKFKPIRDVREENGYRLQKSLEGVLCDKETNISMYITFIIASINYIVISTLHYPKFNGIDFSEENSWDMYKQVLCDYIDMLFEKMGL